MIDVKVNIAKPIVGKTYSLYGGENSSDNFYDLLTICTDEILMLTELTENELLKLAVNLSRSNLRIKKSVKKDPFISDIMKVLRRDFSKYLVNIEDYLRTLKVMNSWDKALSTSFEQYLLYILEIELTNRMHLKQFSLSEKKLAFLPHCLRDFNMDCLASADEIDNLCNECSKICTVNRVSRLMEKYGVIPYIWLNADLKKVFAFYKKQRISIGVIGIACIPELTFGMRLCRKHNIPVLGIPLDANRCSRWMGDFYENSVNTNRLERLLTNNI